MNIYALSSGRGPSGIAIIRLSGKDAFKISEIICKKNNLKTVYKSANKKEDTRKSKGVHQDKIDRILDKISKSGYDTLTQTEKEFLFKQGK